MSVPATILLARLEHELERVGLLVDAEAIPLNGAYFGIAQGVKNARELAEQLRESL